MIPVLQLSAIVGSVQVSSVSQFGRDDFTIISAIGEITGDSSSVIVTVYSNDIRSPAESVTSYFTVETPTANG